MNKLGKSLSVTLLIVALAAPTASAGPWVQGFGHGYIKAGVNYFSASQSFVRGNPVDMAYRSVTTNVYAELGLPARLQFIMDLPYVVATNTASTDTEYRNHTLGDGRIELDFAPIEGFPFSIGLETKLPLYDAVAEQGDGGVIQVDGETWPTAIFPEVGDDNIDLTPKLMIGHAFRTFPVWLSAELGYRARLSGFADGFYSSLGVGGWVWREHIALSVYGNAVINLQDDANPDELATKEWAYVQGSATVTAAPWMPELGLTFSVGRIVWANNSGQGTDFSSALSYSF